jgi:predicted transcriptional regulator
MKAYRFLLCLSLTALLAGIPASAQNQDARQLRKERSEAKRGIYKKAKKAVRKEAKVLAKEGWKTMGLPIEKQLEDTWERMGMINEETGYPRYVFAQSQASAQSYSAAQMQAENLAKVNIASNIASSISSMTDIAVASQELSPTESITVQKVVQNAKVQVAQKLGRVLVPQCLYKEGEGRYTVRVVAMYDLSQAMEIARETLIQELQQEVKENREKLEQLISTDRMAEAYLESEE